jgi:hypothetical protein
LPSLQVVPFAFGTGAEHVPVFASQVPAVLHGSAPGQVLGEPPVQTPDWQESTVVQALPSLQVVPFAAVGFEQAPLLELQVPTV